MKRIINILFALTLTLSAAAYDNSRWEVFPVFSSGQLSVIDTDRLVYFTNSGLFSFDKQSDEQHSYVNSLNGSEISAIYYNHDRNYLLVAYSDANIDLLYDDGRVVNIPSIAISNQTPCSINDAAFDDNNIFVATTFGIVKINEKSAEVIESGIFGRNVGAIAVNDGHLIMQTDSYLYTLPLTASIHKFDNFARRIYCGNALQIMPMDATHLLVRTNNNNEYALRIYEVQLATDIYPGVHDVHNRVVGPLISSGGNSCAIIDGQIFTIATDGSKTLAATLPDDCLADAVDAHGNSTDVWCLNNQGLTNLSLGKTAADASVLYERFCPDAVYTKEVASFAASKSGNELFVYNYGKSAYKPFSTNHESPLTATMINLRTGAVSNITPFPVEGVEDNVKGFQKNGGLYPLNTSMIAVDPDDSNTYFLATGNDGIYKITSGERVGVYNSTNSPIKRLWGSNAFGVHIDRGGNLWVVTYQTDGSSLAVLPADLRKRNPAEIKTTDWIIIDDAGFSGSSDVAFLECQRSGMIFIVSHGSGFQLFAYDTNNTPSNFNDDKAYLWTSMTDQDGKSWTPERRISLVEDNSGRVWLGTNRGVYQITTPANATNSAMRFQKLKIPRNDGTNEADYTLDNDMVYDIAVDSKNRKWVATENSGLVCTNESGNALLGTYTPENSPLQSNRVMSVWVDKNTDNVYVGTLYGLMRYDAAVESATDSFDDILAYPNPVRPDYSGPVYVRGLMDSTLVKIADASGSVVAQGRAENGVFRWDACDFSGKRVKTGIYFVFASSGTEKSSSAVTKIMVIN